MNILRLQKGIQIVVLTCTLLVPSLVLSQDSPWKINKNLRCQNGAVVDDGVPLFDFEIEAIAETLRDQIKEISGKIRSNKANGNRVRGLKKKRKKKKQILVRLRKCENDPDLPLPPFPDPTPIPPDQDPETTPYNQLNRQARLDYCNREQTYFFTKGGPEAICDTSSFLAADSDSSMTINGCLDAREDCLDSVSLLSCNLIVDLRYDCTATAVELLRCSNAITDALRDQADDYNCRSFFYANPPEFREIDPRSLTECQAVRRGCDDAFSTFPG